MGSSGDAVEPPILVSPKKPPPLPEATPPTEAEAEAKPMPEGASATEAPAPAAPITLTAKGLVDLIEGGNLLAVSLAAQSAGVPQGHPGLDPLLTFTPNTRKTLEGLAPAAIPFVQSWLQDHALVGCIVFGGACAWSIAQNMGAAKKLVPAARPAPRAARSEPEHAEPAAEPAPAPSSIPTTDIPASFR